MCEGVWAPVVAAIASVLSHKWVWWVLLVIVVFVVVDGLYSIMAFVKLAEGVAAPPPRNGGRHATWTVI